ncbi:hypothetical protein [Psychrobacter maritimus]|uniref:hypothetical protein n=1 Tax=Psychrobacter maritimus TaxID=256325 RepID=UPI003FD0DD54
MNNRLSGSGLTRAMLERGDEQVWCAVSHKSAEHAMETIINVSSDFIMHIVAFEDGHFLCKEGGRWKYAIPIKKVEITQEEVGL